MGIVLLLVYLAVLGVHGFLLRKALRTPSRKRWLCLFLVQFLSILIALMLTSFFSDLPGSGAMPGLTYFAEAIFSLGAAALYSTGLVCSLVLCLWKKLRGRP